MATKLCSFLLGIIYLFWGIMGLFDQYVSLPPDRLRFYDMHMIGGWGFLFGWMPVNFVHDILYIVMGGCGVLAAFTFITAMGYCRVMFILTANLAIVGLLPLGIDRLWGILPLFGWNVMFHTVTAILSFYYGFIYPLDMGGRELATALH